MTQYDYIRDGQEIYRQSFATIRAEADLSRFSAAEAELAVRMIHACGMVDAARYFHFAPGFVEVARGALDDILTKLKARNIAVLLCGMYAPPNYGAEYTAQFNSIYPELARSHKVPLYPFFLDGVATEAKLTQPDGLHPTAAGVDVVVERILPTVEAFLRDRASQLGKP